MKLNIDYNSILNDLKQGNLSSLEQYFNLKTNDDGSLSLLLNIDNSLVEIKINSKDNTYIVKKVISDDLETLFTRLYLSHVDNFNLPLRGNNNKYVQIENDSYYILY